MEKKPAQIMVIDDDPDLLDMVKEALEIEGYSAIIADNGHDALEALKHDNPDLIILDIMMPGLNGYQVLSAIRMNSTIPIIVLTGIQEQYSASRSLDLGADDYVKKPFSINELLAHIRAKLRRVRPEANLISGDKPV